MRDVTFCFLPSVVADIDRLYAEGKSIAEIRAELFDGYPITYQKVLACAVRRDGPKPGRQFKAEEITSVEEVKVVAVRVSGLVPPGTYPARGFSMIGGRMW
jgi:hypothetical protein